MKSRKRNPVPDPPDDEFFVPVNSSHIPAPYIDPDLEDYPAIVRSAETLRYSAQSLEYVLSPKGRLRWWLLWNLRVFLWIAIPVFLLLPPLVYLFHSLADISLSLHQIAVNAIPIVLIGFFLLFIVFIIGLIKG